MDNFIDELNEQQKEAVTTTEGYVRIIAGAGTGKTKAASFLYSHSEYRKMRIWWMSLEYPHRIYCVSHLQIKRRGR